MIELFSKDQVDPTRQSSKGNQMKFRKNGIWYKTDYLGYEGLTEYVVSKLLVFSSLSATEYVDYSLEQIQYHEGTFNGCASLDFKDGWQLITLERLFQQAFGSGVNQSFLGAADHRECLQRLVEYTEQITGLKDFGVYMSKQLTIDTFFLNEDRHADNMAVMTNHMGQYRLVPYFDQGAGLLSDTTLDYPLDQDPVELIDRARPKTFCDDFDEQLDIAEELYGQHLTFHFHYQEIADIVNQAEQYSPEIRQRVVDILMQRYRKYRYLFSV